MKNLAINDLPNGFVLMISNNCSLGRKNKVLSTHKTFDDAVKAAHALNHVKTDMMIKDIYRGIAYNGINQ